VLVADLLTTSRRRATARSYCPISHLDVADLRETLASGAGVGGPAEDAGVRLRGALLQRKASLSAWMMDRFTDQPVLSHCRKGKKNPANGP
jgi:hypothetical protein